MASPFQLPTVDYDFIHQQLKKSPNLESSLRIGYVTSYFKNGTSPLIKRASYIHHGKSNQVPFEKATALAYKFGFMNELLDWLRDNRQYVDGGISDMAKELSP
jgi:hypothetical protein